MQCSRDSIMTQSTRVQIHPRTFYITFQCHLVLKVTTFNFLHVHVRMYSVKVPLAPRFSYLFSKRIHNLVKIMYKFLS